MLKDGKLSLKKVPQIDGLIIEISNTNKPAKSFVLDAGKDSKYKKDDVVFTSRMAGKFMSIAGCDRVIDEHEVWATEQGGEMVAANGYYIVKVTQKERDELPVRESGIIEAQWEDIKSYTQKGTIVSKGSDMTFAEVGEEIIFTHQIQDTSERLMRRDDFGNEFWLIQSMNEFASEVLGKIINDEIIPVKGKVVALAYDYHSSNNLIDLGSIVTLNHDEKWIPYRVRILNVSEDSAYKKDEPIVCNPASNYGVKINKKEYWFINEDEIMYPDDEQEVDYVEHAFDTKDKGLQYHKVYLTKV